ncbi:putative F-box/LRR-repeat protein At5g54820 [Arachis stenosperma]|uniref:putative F-box/LRR-repeat protein At5g54820 n=1 Tax=Arachis stenosperma TaxID=217475 RepID=UPI0025AD39EC|nr:putative F-box/LRR-repeat protein At5g54820 [Arachis stenosperma]
MAEKETDKLSSLPEDILLYILSSLPFKEAAKTCILSKKWLKLWQSTNTVNNDELEWKNEEACGAVEVAQRKAFKNFFKIWITLQKHHHLHHKFTLKVFPPPNCGDIVGAGVDFAVLDGVKDLELDFLEHTEECYGHASVEFPRSVYENKKLHQKLESLELYSCSLAPGNLTKFEALNDVTLSSIQLTMESVKTLLSTCPWMESLSLKYCWDLESFDIDKLNLKKLVVHECLFGWNYIRFEAPNLKVFKYCGLPPESEVKVVAGTIEEADLDLSPMDEFFACGNELRKFIRDFFAVNVLTVCSVILQQYEARYYTDESWKRFIVPICFQRSLREVEVNGFKGTRGQFDVCSHLIRSTLILRKLSVNVLNDDDPARVVRRRSIGWQLHRISKASSDLVIIIR